VCPQARAAKMKEAKGKKGAGAVVKEKAPTKVQDK
jgi:hypothetical protein